MDKLKCAYCGKEVEQEDAVKAEIVYRNGSQIARKNNNYCSERCASHDQMAHEG
ncbi:YdaE family protein [Citrobacter werkmanii]|uniref:YdaE family protein n=1 Tax=Citrobacter werkmanii TaxID=67827 RepID=UPI00300CFDE8